MGPMAVGFRLHTAEIEVVAVLERDVRLAKVRVLGASALSAELLANTFASCRPASAISSACNSEVVAGKAWAPR